MGFLKVLKQPVQNIWKYALKWTRYFISVFIAIFDLYEHVLATSLEKRKTNFLRLYSWSSLCCHYGISNILLHHQTFCRETLKFQWNGFSWNSCWNRCEHRDGRVSEVNGNHFTEILNISHGVIPEQRWQVLSILLKLWTNGSGSEEQCVIRSDLFPICHRSDTCKF